MEGITDSDYNHAKIDCNDFEIKHLIDVFENLRKMCLEIYQLDPAKVLSAPGLAWKATLEMADVNLEF